MNTNFMTNYINQINWEDNYPMGISLAEIQELEKNINKTLPNSYKEFLLTMGKSAGGFFEDTDIYYDSLFDLKKCAEDILTEEDHNPFKLPDNSFVFAFNGAHAYMEFWYFILNGNEDPPIYYYREKQECKVPVKNYISFSDFLIEHLENKILFIYYKNKIISNFNLKL